MPDTSHLVSLEEIRIELPIAQLGTRGLAQIVDFIIFFLIILFLGGIATIFSKIVPFAGTTIVLVYIVVIFLVFWGYYLFFEMISNGQSPGKRLLGLRVVTSRGGRISFFSSLIRNFLRPVDFLPVFYGVGMLSVLLSSQSQRLGDMAAGTLIVREKKPVKESEFLPLRHYPPSFSSDEVKMVEDFLERIFYLIPERKAILVDLFYDYLEQKHPDLLLGREIPSDLDGKVRAIYGIFPLIEREDA